jgi:hypothetical protein
LSAALKPTARSASPSGEFNGLGDVRHAPSTSIARELQERNAQALATLADRKQELERKRLWLDLRTELIGGLEWEEVDALKAELDELERCMRAMAPDEVRP